MDEHYARNLGEPLHELLSGMLVPRELEWTPEWVEPSPSPKPEKPSIDAITDGFATFSIGDRPPEPREPTKSKTKTRGQPAERPDEIIPDEDAPYLPVPTIAVTRRAHKVFSAILPERTMQY